MGKVQVIMEHLKLPSVDITTTFLINQYKKKILRRNVKNISVSTGI